MRQLAFCMLGLLAALSVARAEAAAFRTLADFDATWRKGRWTFSNGPEFPGARGRFERSKDAARGGQWGGKLSFDFTGGGNYVAAILRLAKAPSVAAVRVRVRKPRAHRLTFRYTDPTGQTVQKGFWAPDDEWADVHVPMADWTGHWGGANDGRIHGPPSQIAILVENTAGPKGALLFDDVRIVEGKPGEAGMVISEYVAARFGGGEGWGLRAAGDAGETRLDGRTWQFDFRKGAASVGIAPRDESLLGMPREIRLRVRGKAPGHPVRLQLATHFMTFEKTIGPLAGEDVSEVVTAAPPGKGWRWFGGENDGKLHGPLRIRGIFLDAAGRKDTGRLELLDVRVRTACSPDRCCVLTAERRVTKAGAAFVATVRNVGPKLIDATVRYTIRDWDGRTLAKDARPLSVPAGGRAAEIRVPQVDTDEPFLEAEFAVSAAGQVVPPAQAYYTAPLRRRGSTKLDPASPFGMGLYLYRYGGDPAGLKQMDRAAALARRAGVKWSREEFAWSRIQPARGKWDWTFYDNVVATAKRHGISVYGLLAYWSRWTKPYTKEGIEDYCRFAAAAAKRYRDDIRYWEVWNEPNIFFWQGPRDLYAELLKKAYAAIKQANGDALVLGCSTAGIDRRFIRRTMQLGAPFDVLTIHPYRGRLDDAQFIAELQAAARLVRRADGTPRAVWITEMGWATHVPHNGSQAGFAVTTQREQARLAARTYLDALASGAAPNISWYDFRNDGRDPFNFEHNLGVVTRDFEPKPAYRAFATVTGMLAGCRVAGRLDLGKGVLAYRFADPGGRKAVVAAWSTDQPRRVPLPSEGAAVLVDLMGRRRALAPSGGEVTVELPVGSPVFVLGD